jgi:hypothetical protein
MKVSAKTQHLALLALKGATSHICHGKFADSSAVGR